MEARHWRGIASLTVVALWSCAAVAVPPPATYQSLVDDNTTLLVDLTPHASEALMSAWTVDGSLLLHRQDYFYRIGNAGGEAPLDTFGSLSSYGWFDTNFDGHTNLVYAKYSELNLADIELTISLVGGSSDSGVSDVTHQLKITNTGESTLEFHLFQYVDFDLADGGEIITDPNSGRPIKVVQSGGAWTVSEVVTPDAGHGEIALLDAPSIYDRLTDNDPSTLADAYGPVGPGDIEYALQWDLQIPAGGSFILSKDILVTPEPGTLVMGLVGLLGLRLMRRPR